MNQSVFISRNLDESGPLYTFLHSEGWKIFSESLIDIQPLEFEISGSFEWIFISSSNGANVLLSSYTPEPNVKIGAAGVATANALRLLGIEPDFVGNGGDMDKVGERFKKTLGGDTVLFVGAEHGSKKIRSAIAPTRVRFIPIYRTILRTILEIPETDVVFLTSPSNCLAYMNYSRLNSKRVIAIGNTTADFLLSKGITDVLVPQSPNEEDVVALFQSL